MAKEPEKTSGRDEKTSGKEAITREAEKSVGAMPTQLEPYPTGDPKGPITWAEINGFVPIGTGHLVPETPPVTRSK